MHGKQLTPIFKNMLPEISITVDLQTFGGMIRISSILTFSDFLEVSYHLLPF